MKNTKLTTKERIGFMTYSAAGNIIYNFKGTYLMIFLTTILQLSASTAGLIVTCGIIWDAVNDPIFATISNNAKWKSGEKIRPYAKWFTIPFAISTVLLFTKWTDNQTLAIVLVGIGYFFFESFYTFYNIPYNSMATVATDNEQERTVLNSMKGLGSCLGSLIGAVCITPLIALFGGLKTIGPTGKAVIAASDSKALTLTVIVLAVLLVAGGLYHYFTTKERIKETNEEACKVNLFQAYGKLVKSKSWLLNVVYIICYSCSTTLLMTNITYYTNYVLCDASLTTPILAFYLVAAIITASLMPKLAKKFGRKMMMLIPTLIMLVGKIPFMIVPNLYTAIIIAFTSGFGLTTIFINLNVNRNVISDVIAERENQRMDSLIAGGDGLIDKLGQAGIVLLISQVLEHCGFDSTLAAGTYQSAASQNAIMAFIGWVPLIFCCIATLVTFIIDPAKELQKVKEQK